MEFSFLDFVWRAMVVAAVGGSLYYVLILAVDFAFRTSLSQRQRKWLFNVHSLGLAIALVLILIFTALDPELSSACFSELIETVDAYPITRSMAVVYLMVVTLLLAWDVLRTANSKIRFKQLSLMPGTRLLEAVNRGRERIMLRRKITVVETGSHEGSPFVWGIRNYQLVIPGWLIGASADDRLEAVLAHELMHIKDDDSLWLLVGHLCHRLLFFHPLAHLVSRRHRLIAEMAADEMAVVQCGVSPSTMVACLIDLASRRSRALAPQMAIQASPGFRDLRQRIHSLARPRKAGVISWRFLLSLALMILGVGPIPMSGASISQAAALRAKAHAGLVCTQLSHEQLIEVWFQMDRKGKQCTGGWHRQCQNTRRGR